jgi:CRISPR/Cas system-associated protein Cas5 (RAMP superfamily)
MGSITNLKENKTVFIPCECQSEVLYIEYDHQLELADLCLYENYNTIRSKNSLFSKIKQIARIISRGTIYSDQIVLQKKQLKDLKNFLVSLDLE